MAPEDRLNRRHFPVIIEQDEDGVYIVSCPMLRGCRSYGETIDKALENIREAIELCLEEDPTAELNRFVEIRDLEVEQGA